MPSPHMISVEDLQKLTPGPFAPRIIDVRTDEDFAENPRLIPGAARFNHSTVRAPVGADVVTVCHKGAKLGQGAAALLRSRGVHARALAGGFVEWATNGGPLSPPARHTIWAAPRGGDLSVLWLIRRYLSPDAEFLIVEPDSVVMVAEKFQAGLAPSDLQTALNDFDLVSPSLTALMVHLKQPSIKTVLTGLSQIYGDELERLAAVMPLFDGLSRAGGVHV